MDNLTHTLVGAALGEAGLKRRTGLAMATLMIAANLPDIDVLAIPFGQSLTFRRGWTHGPLGLVVLPILLTLAVLAWDRFQARRGTRPADRIEVRAGPVLLLAVIGVLSHPFLDWLNTYGIRLLMPFSHEWFYGDAVFILDPWIWLVLGLGILLARRRAARRAAEARRPSQVALGVVVAYIGLMIAGSRWAERATLREIDAQGRGPVYHLMAGPVLANPFRREIIYDSGPDYHFGWVSWSPRLEVELESEPLPKHDDHPAVRQAVQRANIRDFLYWSRFPFFSVVEWPDRFEVNVGDARFSRTPASGWATERTTVERLPPDAP